jgi:tellurite resistance-related uncharacterized protein
MKQLPDNVSSYRKSQTYTDRTTPGMMKNEHRTRLGVWAKIVVQKGEVTYMIPPEDETHTLTPDNPGVIEPAVFHKIDPQLGAKFFLEFYRN